MGGRGASSGMSDKGRRYGTEFETIMTSGNIKFIRATSHDSELFETMTPGRVYVVVNNRNIPKSIYYFDKNLKKTKNIDLTHTHKKMIPHVHHGYEHASEDGAKGATRLTPKEKRMVDRVNRIWYNRKRK